LKISPDYYRTGAIIESYTAERSGLASEATKILHRAIGLYFSMLPKDDPIKHMLERSAKFLDIGCGSGSFIIQLAQSFKNSRYVGVDPVLHGIEMGKKTISQLGLKVNRMKCSPMLV